jgi:hypothetical protein
MMTKQDIIHQHRMTLYNIDLVADWKTAADDHIRIVDVHLLHPAGNESIFKLISGNVFRNLVDDIEAAELKRKWM